MADSSNTIVESREELMISPTSPENPISKTAHFLKPSLSSDSKLPSLSLPSLPPSFDPKTWPLTVNFNGWKNPITNWKEWVHKMAALHAPTWKKAGIYDAILNSVYRFHKNPDLILGVSERWSPETKSFIFPWGEATVTLEDMMVAGFSVSGSPVFEPLESEETKAVEEALIREMRKLNKSSAKKALQYAWLKVFKDSGSEIEHEAFLCLWLSRFVLPTSLDVICKCVFNIAIHLARGTQIALAPAVLASIYRDLSLIKENIVSLNALDASSVSHKRVVVTTWAPFQLLLVWVWERFVKLSPNPNSIKSGDPRFAMWDNLNCKFQNVRTVFDSSKESFSWRPYTRAVTNLGMPKFYRESEMWVSLDSGEDKEVLAFIRCLRASKLVGLDCVEQYLPHRVARQFGYDQDVPGHVGESESNYKDAWSCYMTPVTDTKCYVPSSSSEGIVTKRYMNWWNSLGLVDRVNSSQGVGKQESSSEMGSKAFKGKKRKRKEVESSGVSPKSSKLTQVSERKNSDEAVLDNAHNVQQSTTVGRCSSLKNEEVDATDNTVLPPGFSSKSVGAEAGDRASEENPAINAEILEQNRKDSVADDTKAHKDNGESVDPKKFQTESSVADDNTPKAMEPEEAKSAEKAAVKEKCEVESENKCEPAGSLGIDGANGGEKRSDGSVEAAAPALEDNKVADGKAVL